MKLAARRLISEIPRDAKDITLTLGLVPGILEESKIMASSSRGVCYEGLRESGEKFGGYIRVRLSSFDGLRTIAQEAWTYLISRGYNCKIDRHEITDRGD